jgi:hypothetical protein
MSKVAIIHSDGGARGNPGPAAIVVVLEIDGIKKTYREYLGETTNNQAEYPRFAVRFTKGQGISRGTGGLLFG